MWCHNDTEMVARDLLKLGVGSLAGGAVEIRRRGDIVAVKSQEGRVFGLHTQNLDLAELDDRAWQALSNPLEVSEASQELDSWNKEIARDVSDQELVKQVRHFSINVAQVCNLHCTYCGAGGDGTYGQKTAKVDFNKIQPQIHMFLSQLKSGDEFQIRFFGGEPLLYPSAIKEICRYVELQTAASGIKVRFAVITNGTLVTPKVAELLAHYNFEVLVSLDGPPEDNDRVRPIKRNGPGSTTLVLRGLQELIKVKNQLSALRVNAVFGEHNMNIVKSYEYLRQFPFDLINLTFASSENDEELSRDYVEKLRKVGEIALKKEGLLGLLRITQFKEFISLIHSKTRKHNHCGAGKTFLNADTKGRLYACHWLMNEPEEAVGHGTSIDNNAIKEYEKPLVELNNCQTCWAKNLCGGGCMFSNKIKTGHKHTKDLAYCYRMRGLIALSLEFYVKTLYEGGHSETHKKAQ